MRSRKKAKAAQNTKKNATQSTLNNKVEVLKSTVNINKEQKYYNLRRAIFNIHHVKDYCVRNIAQSYITEILSEIRSFPLSFKTIEYEKDYAERVNKHMKYRIVLLGIIMFLYSLSLFIYYELAKKLKLFTVLLIGRMLYLRIAFGISLTASLLMIFVPLISRSYEVFSIIVLLVIVPVLFWIFYSYCHLNVYFNWHIISNLHFHDSYCLSYNFLYHKVTLDAAINSFVLLAVFGIDILIQPRIIYTAFTHLGLIISIVLPAIWSYKYGLADQKSANLYNACCLIVVICIAYLFSAFQDLRNRCEYLKMVFNKKRLESVYEVKTNQTSNISVAETLLNNLKDVETELKLVNQSESLSNKNKSLLNDILNYVENSKTTIIRESSKKNGLFSHYSETLTSQENKFLSIYLLSHSNINHGNRASLPKNGHNSLSSTNKPINSDNSVTKNNSNNDQEDPSLVRSLQLDNPVLNLLGSELLAYGILECEQSLYLEVGIQLLSPQLENLNHKLKTLKGFLYALEKAQSSVNPFHNMKMAAFIANFFSTCLTETNLITKISWIGYTSGVLASLSTCLAHSGHDQNYYISANSNLALLQNDSNILERLQGFLCFIIAKVDPSINIFANISVENYIAIKKCTLDLLLNLDILKHFEIVSRHRLRRTHSEYDVEDNNDDQALALSLVLKTSVFSAFYGEWSMHQKYVLYYFTEHILQGKSEAALKLQLHGLGKLETVPNRIKTIVDFLTHIIEPPLLELLSYNNESFNIKQCHTRLMTNRKVWQESLSKKESSVLIEYDLKIDDSRFAPMVLHRTINAANFSDLLENINYNKLALPL